MFQEDLSYCRDKVNSPEDMTLKLRFEKWVEVFQVGE